MVDIGLFNYVKNAIGRGETKDSIIATLSASSWSREDIEEAYAAVVNNTPPDSHLHDVSNGVSGGDSTALSITRNHELEWGDFRGKFWTYFVGSIVLGYFTAIPYIGSLFGLGVFICLIVVAYQLASIINDMRGKPGIGTGIVGFFLPPIGFYMASNAAKKAAWNVGISILEHIILWIFFILYALRVSVIIGIIAAVYLSGGHISPIVTINGIPITKSAMSTPVSFAPARTQSDDNLLESDLATLGVTMALQKVGPTTQLCSDGLVNGQVDTTHGFKISSLISSIEALSATSTQAGAGISCYAKGMKFAVSARLPYSGGSYCVDSSGNRMPGTADSALFVCR